MGADFLYAAVEWPVGKNDEATELNRVKMLAEVEHNINKLTLDDIDLDWCSEYEGMSIEEIKEHLHEDLDRLADATMDNLRDAACLRTGTAIFVLTGGMSWGDAPTDTYEAISRLQTVGVYVVPDYE